MPPQTQTQPSPSQAHAPQFHRPTPPQSSFYTSPPLPSSSSVFSRFSPGRGGNREPYTPQNYNRARTPSRAEFDGPGPRRGSIANNSNNSTDNHFHYNNSGGRQVNRSDGNGVGTGIGIGIGIGFGGDGIAEDEDESRGVVGGMGMGMGGRRTRRMGEGTPINNINADEDVATAGGGGGTTGPGTGTGPGAGIGKVGAITTIGSSNGNNSNNNGNNHGNIDNSGSGDANSGRRLVGTHPKNEPSESQIQFEFQFQAQKQQERVQMQHQMQQQPHNKATATTGTNYPRSYRTSQSEFQSRSQSQSSNPDYNPNSVSNPISNPTSFAWRHRAASSSASSSGAPPRKSSLLPPPRHTNNKTFTPLPPVASAASSPDTIPPSNVERSESSATFLFDPLNSPRRHSRASSTGAASEGFRNLNRWSSSTASSRASAWDHFHLQQQQQQTQQTQPTRLNSFSRRMSVDSVGILTDPNFAQSPPQRSSPRKLSKRRPSTGTNVSPRTTLTAQRASPALSSGTSAPPPNLPPIVSLPSLDIDPETVTLSTESSARAMSRASPATTTPNSIFSSQHNGEPRDYFWNELANPAYRTASPVTTRSNQGLLPAATLTRDSIMPEKKGHARTRSGATKSSAESTKTKDRSSKPSQKAMLSKALSKANAAVQLDNAQNYEAARESYLEACDLLHQVLARTNGEDDRRKLEAIRQTYTSRIEELDGLLPMGSQDDKALPARPDSLNQYDVHMDQANDGANSQAAHILSRERYNTKTPDLSSRYTPSPSIGTDQLPLQSSFSKSPMRRNFEGNALNIPRTEEPIIPPPLSPRRPASSPKTGSPESIVRQDFSVPHDRFGAPSGWRGHRRAASHESASWLDPIEESGGSAASSVHSRSSSLGIRRKHLRHISGDTEAEFDAALDAAVEAAYDEGFDPMEPADMGYDMDGDGNDLDVLTNARRKVEMAKERVRQTEREAAIELARERERHRQLSLSQESQTFNGDFFDANDSDEEEERMLEEMTRGGYLMEDFTFNQPSKSRSNVPRESDSSGLTSRTWHSSIGSSPPTAMTGLSTVTEMAPPPISKESPPSLPPPPQALPQLPQGRPPSATGVRSRRLSGQNAKQLKIETSKIGQPPNIPLPPISTTAVPSKSSSNFIAQQRQALSATSTRPGPFSMRAPSSPGREISPSDTTAPQSPTNLQAFGLELDDHRTGSPASTRHPLRENFSSSSLRTMKTRQVSVSHMDDSDMSPNTPLSHQLSNSVLPRPPAVPALPTPIMGTFHEKMAGGFSGIHLFDSDFHSPTARSPSLHHQQLSSDIPMPLEPCPSDGMLRPFWLMRALYQTLAHPRGGYLSNRLFVPRDAWKVKGVKLRAVEDKISQCDLLTAALLKLARVDSNDADAVLEEMQSFESILESVQNALTRKLGAEVGTQGVSTFRDEKDGEATPAVPRSSSVSSKAGAFSWRRLKSKGSGVNLSSAYGSKSSSGGGTAPTIPEKDVLSPGGSIPSLPMTAHPSSRPAKRDVTSVKFDGPWANYMASLARLFDAAQTVDQIARQVEDPGLRHADKTQVGLELCTRHAAEFFGFYICRFVLADLALLLDKFVKRGSEWVLN